MWHSSSIHYSVLTWMAGSSSHSRKLPPGTPAHCHYSNDITTSITCRHKVLCFECYELHIRWKIHISFMWPTCDSAIDVANPGGALIVVDALVGGWRESCSWMMNPESIDLASYSSCSVFSTMFNPKPCRRPVPSERLTWTNGFLILLNVKQCPPFLML